jgi:hypothetical protein
MNIAGYVRVSTEDQAREGVSLAAQWEKIHAYALVKDWRAMDMIQDASAAIERVHGVGVPPQGTPTGQEAAGREVGEATAGA